MTAIGEVRHEVRYEDVPGGPRVIVDQRTEVYTASGWVDVRELVAAYDNRQTP